MSEPLPPGAMLPALDLAADLLRTARLSAAAGEAGEALARLYELRRAVNAVVLALERRGEA